MRLRERLPQAASWCILVLLSGGLRAAEFRLDGLTLTVPDGFTVVRAAGPPLVDRPVTFALDERGRLYVGDSSGSNAPPAEQVRKPTHRVVRLEDRDSDGFYDRRTVFAEELMIPQGTAWHRGSLYVAAPPVIWKFTDHDDDGVAEERSVWFDGQTLTKCANDLHGPVVGPDGWFYWCKGSSAEQTHDLPGRPGWRSRAAHVYRARPDATGLEVVLTGDMENPVDVAFTPTGEPIVSATFLAVLAGGRRDGLLHAVYGGVWGRRDGGVLDGHERTGDLMPVMTHLGPAAVSNIHFHSGHGFGPEYAANLFACQFNTRTVSRHVLAAAGSTYATTDSAFLVADSPDFHPTDVIEDADGSLLVADTGGWYKLCCPTSQFEKAAVLGAIYRITRDGARPVADPRGLDLDWSRLDAKALAALLADPRPAVAARAGDLLSQRGDEAVGALADGLAAADDQARLAAVWALGRCEGGSAAAVLRTALGAADPAVRHAAVRACGLRRDREATAALVGLLSDDDPGTARAAAEALGRSGAAEAVEPLLAAVPRAVDRQMEHALVYALVEIARPEPLVPVLAAADPRVRRAALVALDQMAARLPAPALPRDQALAMCREADGPLHAAAWWVAARHPEWSADLAGAVGAQCDRAARLRAARSAAEADRIVETLARIAERPGVAEAVAAAVRAGAGAEACAVMRASRPLRTPDAWVVALAAAIEAAASGTPPTLGPAAVDTLATLGLSAAQRDVLRPTLVAWAARDDAPSRAALAALRIATDGDARLEEIPGAVVGRLLAFVDPESSPLDRAVALTVLAAGVLPGSALEKLADALAWLPGADAARVLPILTKHGGPHLARGIRAVNASIGAGGIPRGVLEAAVAALDDDEAAMGRETLGRIAEATAADRDAFHRLEATLPPGDPVRGHRVFTGSKAACSTCHAMAFVGGNVGPDLTTIGRIRTPRDLLEAIVLPSASFVRSYEPVTILTTDGRAFQGIAREETTNDILLQTGPTSSERLPRDEIESLDPGTVSLMPKGYDTLLSPQELADLVAFLSRAR